MAAPNPEQQLEQLAGVLSSDAPPRVYCVNGAARWFRDRALDLIRGSFGGDREVVELDGAEARGKDADLAEFLMDLRTSNLFGASKLLLLRNAESWLREHGKLLSATFDKLASGNVLVLDVTRIDGRTAIAKTLKKNSAWFEFRQLYEKPFDASRPPQTGELAQWVRARASERGMHLSPDTAWFIVQVSGTDPAVLDGELDRLAPVCAGETVDPERLRPLLTIAFGSSQFELVDAILVGDLRAALRSLVAMYRQGLRDRDGKSIDATAVFPMVSSWLVSSLANLIEARAAVDAGEPERAVVQRYGGFFKGRFAQQLARHDRASLERIHAASVRAERRLRLTGEEPEILLERLLSETLLVGRRAIGGHGVGASVR